ncbi:MAG: CheR family methyltransferase [Deltaproteobacteria bacterium]|nr:CheR family methyltransferase [Deltaproteobacteria bacterium]
MLLNGAYLKNKNKKFPIVGIGASAGGLEAFEGLLRHLPGDTGMAFVFIQHLSPQHPSLLAELLLQSAKMPVCEAGEGNQIKPNHIYVISPNIGLTISRGVFHVTPREEKRGIPMPIDLFLFSLAKERRHQSIGIILSGNASDGTLGLEAIKAAGGMTFAQEEKSAKFHGMPKSAIGSGSVDFILTPRGIGEKLAKLAQYPLTATGRPERQTSRSVTAKELQAVFSIISRATGVDFSLYKRGTILRRIQRRLDLHRIKTLQEYVTLLRGDPRESQKLMEDFLIHVTSFFRDPLVFEYLKKNVYPKLLKDKSLRKPCRVWIPGCSTGEEVYSIAMGLMEVLEQKSHRSKQLPIKIFATDISDLSVEQARKGLFKKEAVSGVSAARLNKFFTKTKDGYEIHQEIRDLCIFKKHNLILEAPFLDMDFISCRNLFIYLGSHVQNKIVPVFHRVLHSNGFFLLGKAETLGSFPHLFEMVDKKSRLYQKKELGIRTPRRTAETKTVENSNKENKGVRGEGRLTQPQQLSEIVQDGQLRKALEATKKTIDIVITRFEETNEKLQATNEELHESNEELLVTNEKLETAKEELQSTNEELQSTNEELTTLNEEVQNRNIELRLAREFADSIIETIREPLLILDADLKVVRANAVFYESFKLTAPETERKYLYSLAKGQWDIPRLRILLEKIIPKKKGIANFEIEHDFPAIGYRTLLLNARQISRPGGAAPMILVAIDLLTMENRVTKKIVEYSEGEKQRVGKDLHDGLGQSMTGIALLSKSLEKKLINKKMPESKEAAKITRLVKQGIFEINRLARGLTPIALENVCLIPALTEAVAHVTAFFGVRCVFECKKEAVITLDPKRDVNLYYIAQEAINNAIRHGKAKQIRVKLERRMKGGKELVLSISDNGLGLPKNFEKKEGMGLRIMRYRASDIGASFEIHQGAIEGAVVIVRYPLTEAR